MFINSKQSNRGLTLIEVVIVATVFSVIITMTAGFFVSAMRAERWILETKKALGEASYALEYMTRALRMARKDKSHSCIASGVNYEIQALPAGDKITFVNTIQEGACQSFYLDNGQIKLFDHNTLIDMPLTSPSIQVENLRFKVSGETNIDAIQPMVTIYFEAKSGQGPALQVQTSVSQRNLDIK